MGVATRCVVGGRAAGLRAVVAAPGTAGLELGGQCSTACSTALRLKCRRQYGYHSQLRFPISRPSVGAGKSGKVQSLFEPTFGPISLMSPKLDSSVFGKQCRKEVVTMEFVTTVDMRNSGLLKGLDRF